MGIFDYEFMRNAFAASTIVAVVAGAIGYFLVLRGETFAGHALSHVGFSGATGAVLIGVSPLIGLTAFTILAGLGISLVGERAHRDVAIGLVLTVSLGLGLLFLHFYTSYAGMATNLLFGNVLGIGWDTVLVLAGMAVVTLLGLAAISRPLLFASLQPELAEAKGVPMRMLSALFMVIVALATAQAIQIVGILLVFALMVAPAATALRLTRRFASGLALSIGLAVGIAWLSLVLAYVTDWPTSFWITGLGGAIYLLSGVLASLRSGRSIPRGLARPTAD
jgi:zinc/manganese transport system permease protein